MKRIEDILLFGKIISTAFLIGGYIFFGLLAGKKLSSMGYPEWLEIALPLLMAAIGLWQGWLYLRNILQKK
ncbi:MAG: hypothetical protein GX791_04555 [Synergistaceae bacterium]|nr:hypothetical protein [Synergistaceae bacterium]